MKHSLVQIVAAVLSFLSFVAVDAFVPPQFSQATKRLADMDLLNTRNTHKAPSEARTSTATQLYMSSLIDEKELINFFLMKLIENGVPATFTIITILFAAKAFKGKSTRDDALAGQVNPAVSELYEDLYGGTTDTKPSSIFSRFGRRSNRSASKEQILFRNAGIPAKQYISVKSLNEKYDSYEYNMVQATQSKAAAAAALRTKNFDRALQVSTTLFGADELKPHEISKLIQAEENLLKAGSRVMATIISAETQLTDLAIREEMAKFGFDVNVLDPPPANDDCNRSINETSSSLSSSNFLSNVIRGKNDDKKMKKELETTLVNAQKSLLHLETTFIQNVTQVLGPTKVGAFRAAVLGDISTRGVGQLLRQLQDRPLSTMLGISNTDRNTVPNDDPHRKKSLFVMRFPGDIRASQVNELREEVTAVVRAASAGDEALLVLESGGGTVTGYGLAAGQLKRFKEAGIKLTVCVEQVAASGGYMMCCVADRIVASPMAVLGSIGVITDIPNFYERLQKEGIEFQTVTAGKFKRTLTPTKKATKEDFQKTKEDVENILVLFKRFVKENRPVLDIDAVATGETWFGTDALERGLCDEIKTADTCLGEFVDNGYNVYEIKYSEPPTNQLSQFLGPASDLTESSSGIFGRAIRWLVSTIKTEIEVELDQSTRTPIGGRYLMQDDTSEHTRLEG